MKPYYYSLKDYNNLTYKGRIQKISLSADFTCPNRDGTKGYGGCTYCNNESFGHTLRFDNKKNVITSIEDQMTQGLERITTKYPNILGVIAYFQTYSNTYAELPYLKQLYEKALSFPKVMGLSIGTRSDCIDEEKLDYLKELNQKFKVTLEYGLESFKNDTLKKINRGHDYENFLHAISITEKRNIDMCVHLIIGFPWENLDDWIAEAKEMNRLPIKFIKLHQLHIVRGTVMGAKYLKSPFKVLNKSEYFNALGVFLSYLRPDIVVERLFGHAPPELLLSPSLGSNSGTLEQEFLIYLQQNKIFQGMNCYQTNSPINDSQFASQVQC